MTAQLPFNTEETVLVNTPMIAVMNDTANAGLALKNLSELKLLYQILAPSSDFLEIGCGSGYLIEELSRRGKGTYHGIEPIPSEAEKAVTRLKKSFPEQNNFRLIQNKKIEDADIAERSLDFIYSNHVFEHLENPLIMLNKAKKWLKPGGSLIIICPNVEGYFPQKNLVSWRCTLSSHRWLPGVSTISRAVTENGFRIQRLYTYGGFPAPRAPLQTFFNYLLKLSGKGDVLCLHAVT